MPAIVKLAHDRDRGLAGGDAGRLVAVAEHDMVDPLGVAVHALAVADRKADQVLQLDGHMLDHVPGKGAVAHPLQKAAGFTDRTAVPVDRWKNRLQLVRDAGHLVARLVFKVLDVEAHVDRLIPAIVIRAAQGAKFEYFYFVCSRRFFPSSSALSIRRSDML